MALDVPHLDFGPPAVPAFLSKLRLLVDDEETNDLIYWDPGGNSFHICNGNRLAKEVLPLFFKHNNLSSFVRQLNMYGFRKVNRVDPCLTFKSDIDDMEFKHPYFLRHRPHLISKIQRKPPSHGFPCFNNRLLKSAGLPSLIANSAQPPSQTTSADLPQRLITAADFIRLSNMVHRLRQNQESMAKQMTVLQSENDVLLHEVQALRDRHEHQSQIIQTLFSFLSAFTKDNRSQNFRITPKRMALPFAASGVFPAQSRTGLKLNLPQGHRLSDTDSFQAFKLSPSGDVLEPAFKLFKLDNHLPMLPNAIPSLTDQNQPVNFQIANSDFGQLLNNADSSSLLPNDIVLGDNSQSSTALYSLGGLENNTLSASPMNTTTGGRVRNPIRLSTAGQPKAFSTNATDDVCLRPDIKPVISSADPTMTSLTQGSNATAITSPIDLMCNAAAPNGTDGQPIDLNLSRCATPLSLLQPDSVDLCEFLANREENGSDISIDDLFLASTELDDPNFRFTAGSKSDKSAPSPGAQSSASSEATVPLKTDCANEDLSPQLDPMNTSASDSLNETLFGYGQSATGRAAPALSVAENSLSQQLPLDLQKGGADVDASEDPDNLFGLPWEEQEITTDVIDEDKEHIDEGLNSFNIGLLPAQDRANLRIKILPRPDRATYNSTGHHSALNGHNFIVGNEIIPAEAAVPFANVSAPFQILQPAALIPASIIPAQTGNAVNSQSLPSSPPVILSARPLRSPSTLIAKSATVPSTSNLFVADSPIVVFTSAPQPLNLNRSTNAVANAIKARLASSPNLRPTVRRKERPTLRPIAPCIKPPSRLQLAPKK